MPEFNYARGRIEESLQFITGEIKEFELESPLLGGDLGVGKAIIREIFTEISRPRNPPLTPPKRGIIHATL